MVFDTEDRTVNSLLYSEILLINIEFYNTSPIIRIELRSLSSGPRVIVENGEAMRHDT